METSCKSKRFSHGPFPSLSKVATETSVRPRKSEMKHFMHEIIAHASTLTRSYCWVEGSVIAEQQTGANVRTVCTYRGASKAWMKRG